jgi:hypothetical protein
MHRDALMRPTGGGARRTKPHRGWLGALLSSRDAPQLMLALAGVLFLVGGTVNIALMGGAAHTGSLARDAHADALKDFGIGATTATTHGARSAGATATNNKHGDKHQKLSVNSKGKPPRASSPTLRSPPSGADRARAAEMVEELLLRELGGAVHVGSRWPIACKRLQ